MTGSASHDPVLIAGGGIGGLAAALALARLDIPVMVLERRLAFSEDGAGIQLGPNATRIIVRLGLADRLRPFASAPEAIAVHNGRTGRRLASIPLGDTIKGRFGAPYWSAHRRDVHTVLLDAVGAHDLVTIVTDAPIAAVAETAGGVTAHAADGRSWTGRALIAADGAASSIRCAHFDAWDRQFLGKSAARAVLSRDHLPAAINARETSVWLAPDTHLVAYPVRDGREIAIVAIFPDAVQSEGWGTEISSTEVSSRFSTFAPQVRELIAAAPEWRKWALRNGHVAPRLARSRMALLGDAAHPILPFLAQGAAMALEDAAVLADSLSSAPHDVASALQAYSAIRAPRVRAVAAASERNGRIYHLSGPAAEIRNVAMRMVSGRRILARYAWLYGYHPQLS